MSERTPAAGCRRRWRDDPITTTEQDRFRRTPVAQRAATLIAENHCPDSSVVYGLEGPWGSGKSSVIALITEDLRGRNENWQVVAFTPWATSGTDELFSEFFAALSTVSPKAGKADIQKLIRSYADIARPLASLIPFVGAAAGELTEIVATRLEKPWSQAFDETASAIREMGTPVLVVVDDIDRLQAGELLDLLKVVRLLGRFPGVDFLLAYDERTLVDSLQAHSSGGGSRTRARLFMEKIIQYPLNIPPLLTSQVIRVLDDRLTELLGFEGVQVSPDIQRLSRLLQDTMPRQLTTPRAIERFLAQVSEQFLGQDRAEVNDVDLIVATFLRVQFPDVFARIQMHKADLTRAARPFVTSSRPDESVDWGTLVKDLDSEEDRLDAMDVLRALFPAVRGGNHTPAQPGRFAHRDYFDRYLAQGIPENDIPDAMVSEALEAFADGSQHQLGEIILGDDRDRARLAVSKIRARYPDVDEVAHHEGPMGAASVSVLGVAMQLLGAANEDETVTLWTSVTDLLMAWAVTVLRRVVAGDWQAQVDPALARCANVRWRVEVLTKAAGDLTNLSDESQSALKDALQREVDGILPLLLDDLRDDSGLSGKPSTPWLYGLVAGSAKGEELRAELRRGVESRELSIEDIAARFVTFYYTIGGSGPSRASFEGALFQKVTGLHARSAEWVDIRDWEDTSLSRRREFAAQFVSSPHEQEAAD